MCFWSAAICPTGTFNPKSLSCIPDTYMYSSAFINKTDIHSYESLRERLHITDVFIWMLKYTGPFRHSYKTTNSASVSTMPEVLFQLLALVLLCYFWQVKLRLPLARHTTEEDGKSFLWMWLQDGWVRRKEVFTIIRRNNCLISSYNACLTPFDGLMVGGFVFQRRWEQRHRASLFKPPVRESQ